AIYGAYSLATNRLYLVSNQSGAGAFAEANLWATGGATGGGIGQAVVYASGNGTSAQLSIVSTGASTLSGQLTLASGYLSATSLKVVGGGTAT
ncbi:hypothetical protein, partial [Lactococcus petauri]|uniref:hypothetical protein n=1 Tax=Lactococcus petauri TaxID=1940789 RepID=UPI0021F22E3D